MLTDDLKTYLSFLRPAVLRLSYASADGISLEDTVLFPVFSKAYEQSQAELLYTWFLEQGLKLPKSLEEQLKLSYDHALHRELLMNTERERIFGFMDEHQILHCPLKGILIQPLYPAVGTRYASDNDILVDPDQCEEIKKFMTARGYKFLGGTGKHDGYLKNPSYHFEMHKTLMDEIEEEREAADYLNKIWPRLRRVDPASCLFEMTPEDFYIHLLAHALHHYKSRGTGLRYIVDVYYYLQSFGSLMDQEMLSELLKKLHLDEFEQILRSLSEKLFSKEVLATEFTAKEEKVLEYMFRAGSHGNDRLQAKNRIKSFRYKSRTKVGRKWEYVMKRAFPEADWWKTYHPFLYKYKLLIPFYAVYRLGKGVLFSEYGREEIRQVFSGGKETNDRDH